MHPHLARSRLAPRLSPRGRPTETKAPYDTIGDPEVSRPPRSLRRTVSCALFPRALIPHGLETRAWALSSHGAKAIEPLTLLSQSIVQPQRLAELPRRCLLLCLGHTSAFLRVGVNRGLRRPPRPSPSPARESLRRVTARSAFHHQGPFTGSGGHYSPGPATDAPLLAMSRPLDGALAPPWVFARTSPHHVRVRGREPRHTFHSLHPPMVSPIAVHFELDPRSLDPAALFGARMPSLFEVRRRLMTSATALSTCGQPNLGSVSSQGRWPRPPSFSYASRRSFEQ